MILKSKFRSIESIIVMIIDTSRNIDRFGGHFTISAWIIDIKTKYFMILLTVIECSTFKNCIITFIINMNNLKLLKTHF